MGEEPEKLSSVHLPHYLSTIVSKNIGIAYEQRKRQYTTLAENTRYVYELLLFCKV